MLVVECQNCGQLKVLAGSPGPLGVARVAFTCCHCGVGQVLLLSVSAIAEGGDVKDMVLGMGLGGSHVA